MTTTEVPWPGSVDLRGFVRREEDELLRLAFLVTGDLDRSRGLVEDALVAVGRRWPQAREEHPEDEVRRLLHRNALRPPGDETPAGATAPSFALPEADWSTGPLDGTARNHRAEVAHALGLLTPRQRAVLGLMGLEGMSVAETSRMLRVLPHTVRSEARAALERLHDSLPDRHLGGARVDGPALLHVLDEATSGLPAPDLGERVAERAAQRRHTVRRRGVLTAGGAIAAGGLGVVLLDRLGGGEPTPPRVDSGLETVTSLGVTIQLAPDPADEVRLPSAPDRSTLGVPDPVGPGEPRDVMALPAGGIDDRLLAVYLVGRQRGSYTPVVQTGPLEDGRGLWSVPVRIDTEGLRSTACGPRTVSVARRRIVLFSAGRVVVVDPRRGSVLEVPVPSPTLKVAGWASDERTVVALGRDGDWVIWPERGRVMAATEPVYPGRYALDEDGGATRLRSFSTYGSLTGETRLPGSFVVPVGVTASTVDGWAASTALLPEPYQAEVGRSQGIVAVRAGRAARSPYVLAAAFPSGGTVLRYRVLGWAGAGRLLVESLADGGGPIPTRTVLVWEVEAARLWRVADVVGVDGRESWFTGQWAL